MEQSKKLKEIYQIAIEKALEERKEFMTPEHLLWSFVQDPLGQTILLSYRAMWSDVIRQLERVIRKIDRVPDSVEDYDLVASAQLEEVFEKSEQKALMAGRNQVDVPHMLDAILDLDESMASYLLQKYTTTDRADLLSTIVKATEEGSVRLHAAGECNQDDDDEAYVDQFNPFGSSPDEQWRGLVSCVNDQLPNHNPLIGRQAELQRTIQVLCRKEKNNPLHIGEPGVGKTALVFGLAAMIEAGNVPERLKGSRIYQMDMGSMVAGTSYRGDFEKRMKSVLEGIRKEGNGILYIDELHTIVGSGALGDGALDAANILKPYLESGEIRFIGSTTYKEYNRYLQKSQGLSRRFQQIDIAEPTVEETTLILEGLKEKYENFHKVVFEEGVIEYAVKASARHISARFLPDKAIDLIDEAGAYRQLHPQMRRYRGALKPARRQGVGKELIAQVLANMIKVSPNQLQDEDTNNLETLEQRLSAQIYGQDPALRQITEAVQMGKAGLLEEGKPIASFLFVGPTGVGKTEVCKVLAQELGIGLVRFDMSEYTEKHAVAKLIGSPAGYVGYEDGGLLTDAIRKTPNCVLLLDEIEKAHADIYNLLLQVMDYARLTDNKGEKADFRNVILIMTSNAGAQFAHQGQIGFGNSQSAGDVMLSTVKKTFKPEFLARLSATVVFNDMDRDMAKRILNKKIQQLQTRLSSRNVELKLSASAEDLLLRKGFSPSKGAREMDHVINQLLTPLLSRQILFGPLKHGGVAQVEANGEALTVL